MSENEAQTINHILEVNLEYCTTKQPLSLTDWDHVAVVMTNFESGKNTATLHVLITLLAKKIMSPEKDIRYHQRNMEGGFSGRMLDSNCITPFLREHNLTQRPTSGWQTHSMEHNHPFDERYPGNISPVDLKTAFLSLVHRIQTQDDLAQQMLSVFLAKMVELRERSKLLSPARPTLPVDMREPKTETTPAATEKTAVKPKPRKETAPATTEKTAVKRKPRKETTPATTEKTTVQWEPKIAFALIRPKNNTIEDAVALVDKLCAQPDASRIPVLAVFAVYQCLVKQVGRYKDHVLLPLQSPVVPDGRISRAGDIDLVLEGKPVEAVEVRHGIEIEASVVEQTIEKIKRTTVRRCYILGTNNRFGKRDQIKTLIVEARTKHGLEIIVDGVARTLERYLRLVSDIDDFTDNFVELLESDDGVSGDLKRAWDAIQ